MNDKVKLRAGIPDDDNRDYLPAKLKNSEIVVNENGNNSIPYPEGLQEIHESLLGEGTDTWYEYVPASYNPQQPAPLVIGLHGGLMTGWGHAVYTSWTLLAEREGIILAFPDAHDGLRWSVERVTDHEESFCAMSDEEKRDRAEKNYDMRMILALIHRMQQKYNIDSGRIFMQGMSMGNLMTSEFARYHGDILAGAAGSGGPSQLEVIYNPDGHLRNAAGPLPVWQSRPELNGTPRGKNYNEFDVNKFNRYYWMQINQCDPIPQIRIQGDDNFSFFTGKKADVVLLDIYNRDHGQTLDEAFLYWDYLFSGVRREANGQISRQATRLSRQGDAFAVAFASGCSAAWFGNQVVPLPCPVQKWQKLKYHGLNGGQLVRGEYLCAPLSFLAKVFGASCAYRKDNTEAEIRLTDGRCLQFARGSIGCVVDDDLRSMNCEALYRDGELLVSAEWFCGDIMNLHVSLNREVLYATDHVNRLSANTADLLRDLLTGKAFPPDLAEAYRKLGESAT